MRTHIAIMFLLLLSYMPGVGSAQTETSGRDKCFTCHQALGDKASTLFSHDIHRKKGVTCAGCHGGNSTKEDMEEGMSKAAGFIGVPRGDEVSAMCARCHDSEPVMAGKFNSRLPLYQSEMLRGSVHGKSSTTGGERIAQCTTCHGSHGIRSAVDPQSPVNPRNVPATCSKCHASASYMRTYNPALPVDQLEKYRTSMHGILNAKGDQKVAECASCHGSHQILAAGDVKSKVYPTNIPGTCASCHSDEAYMKGYAIPSDQLKKFKSSVHGVALLERGDLGAPSCNDCHGNHGAIPPGVESISKVCGTCHALNATLFASSPHKKAFDKMGLPECETCHNNHDIVAAKEELVGVAPETVCSRCHDAASSNKGYHVAKTMRTLIDSLNASEAHARMLVDDAEQKGMEVSESRFKLLGVRQARLESRTMVHSFDETQFSEVINKGLSAASLVAGEGGEAIEEYYFRRWGAGVSTLIITIFAISLYLMIRRIERRQKNQPTT